MWLLFIIRHMNKKNSGIEYNLVTTIAQFLKVKIRLGFIKSINEIDFIRNLSHQVRVTK